jgi:hypothetical protein
VKIPIKLGQWADCVIKGDKLPILPKSFNKLFKPINYARVAGDCPGRHCPVILPNNGHVFVEDRMQEIFFVFEMKVVGGATEAR